MKPKKILRNIRKGVNILNRKFIKAAEVDLFHSVCSYKLFRLILVIKVIGSWVEHSLFVKSHSSVIGKDI